MTSGGDVSGGGVLDGHVSAGDGVTLRAAEGALWRHYDAVLLDLDGVVYLGPEPIEGAAEAVGTLRGNGIRVVFVTNNASRAPGEVAARLVSVDVPAIAEDVVTSAQAAASLLAARLPAGGPVLVLGAAALGAEIAAVGLRPVLTADPAPLAVVNGYSDDLSYGRMSEAALAIRAGAQWVATNLDATIPTPRGLLPGNGAISALLATATGRRPEVAGKPQRPLLDEAVRRAGGRRPLFVGDRLDTDIGGACSAGLDSLLVLTGVADVAGLFAAPRGNRPTYVDRSLSGVLVAHPAVQCRDDVATCGGWRASSAADGITVTGAGRELDAVRAAAVLSWAHVDRGQPVPAVDGLPTRPGS